MTGAMTNQVMPEIVTPVVVVMHHVVDHEEFRPEEEVIEGVSIQTIGVGQVSEDSENFRNYVMQMRMFPSVISARLKERKQRNAQH